MSVSTVHSNPGGLVVVQRHEHASAARVSDNKGRHMDVRYDEATDQFIIEMQDVNYRVYTGSNKIWITKP